MKNHFISFLCLVSSSMLSIGQTFYVGTNTRKSASKGIYQCKIDKNGQLNSVHLAVEVNDPSYLSISKNGKFLFSTTDRDPGKVASFRIVKNKLELINKRSSGGVGPCYVSNSSDGYVLVSNYRAGNVGLLKHNKKGELSELIYLQQHEGNDTHKRQQGPHAHSVWLLPNEKDVISVDLGTNELWFSTINKKKNTLEYNEQQKLKMEPGAGPRHVAFHPNEKFIYVLNEINGTLTVVEINENKYEAVRSYSTLPEEFEEKNSCADVVITSDGKFIFASNRGHNSIAVFKTNETGGQLERVGFQKEKIDWPRNITLSTNQKYLLVANQNSNLVTSYRINKQSGELNYVSEASVPAPVCLVFID